MGLTSNLTPLMQYLSQMRPTVQSQLPSINVAGSANPGTLPSQPTQQQQGSGNNPIMKWLGGLGQNIGAGASAGGATGAANGLDQGLAFGAAPAGAMGPFQASSALQGLSAGAGATQAAGATAAGGATGIAGALAPLLALL